MLHQILLSLALFAFLYTGCATATSLICLARSGTSKMVNGNMLCFALSGALLVFELTFWIVK